MKTLKKMPLHEMISLLVARGKCSAFPMETTHLTEHDFDRELKKLIAQFEQQLKDQNK